jgi:tripartite-type tricarboxylate transporter receptor subunit TctC
MLLPISLCYPGTAPRLQGNTMIVRTLAFAASAAIAAIAIAAAAPAEFPRRGVTIVVPFPAGGTADAVPRIVGGKLAERWGQSVIIENRPGAAGTTGSTFVANAAPDGHTLLSSPAGPLVINRFVQKSFSFDPLQLTPITIMAGVPTVLAVRANLPAKSVGELVAYAKQQKGGLNYGSQGPGSTSHLSAVLFQNLTGIPMVHVPYKGSAPALADLVGGNIDLMFDNLGSALPLHRTGQIRILGVGTAARAPALPDTPTIEEQGLRGYRSSTWFALVAPPRTETAIADKIAGDVADILKMEDVRGRLTSLGLEPLANGRIRTAEIIAAESKQWEAVVQAAKLPKE